LRAILEVLESPPANPLDRCSVNLVMASHVRTFAAGCLLLSTVAVGCHGKSRPTNVPTATGNAAATTRPLAASPTTDWNICTTALRRLAAAGYDVKAVAVAFGGTRAAVQSWLDNRPESAGVVGPLNRGINNVGNADHVRVCVYSGDFPYPHPPRADGTNTGPGDGARFIVAPDGTPTLDAMGSLASLSRTPAEFNSAG